MTSNAEGAEDTEVTATVYPLAASIAGHKTPLMLHTAPMSDNASGPPPAAPPSFYAQVSSFDYVFWLCIFMELMERMAYYGVRLVVPVYMVLAPQDGGPGLTHTEKGTVLACWAAMQSWLPTISGGFSDRFGYKNSIAVSVFLKAGGYALMATASGFWGMLIGTQVLAAGTGIFKPGIQGTMAHSIAKSKGSDSMGWGLFYQSVNVGAAVAAYIPAFAREKWGWHGVFWTCSVIVFSNLIPLFFYADPVDERQTVRDTRGPIQLMRETLRDLFTNPVVMGFILISAGFWFMFHQLFDMLPNYVDDWTDSSVLLAALGTTFGRPDWVAEAAKGVMIPQERLLNVNALLIMTTMFAFAWVSGKVRVLTSTITGMAISTIALVAFVFTANVYIVMAGVLAFTVGEMLASPKKQEYMASLAPPGKRALFLGYANMPDGIGWVLGSLVAGGQYEEHGDKINLARRFFAEHGDVAVARAWLAKAHAGGVPAEALKELAERMKVDTGEIALTTLDALDGAALVTRWSEALPRGEVLDSVIAGVPMLPNGVANSAPALRDYLYATMHPGQVWHTFIVIGAISVVAMVVYDRVVRRRAA